MVKCALNASLSKPQACTARFSQGILEVHTVHKHTNRSKCWSMAKWNYQLCINKCIDWIVWCVSQLCFWPKPERMRAIIEGTFLCFWHAFHSGFSLAFYSALAQWLNISRWPQNACILENERERMLELVNCHCNVSMRNTESILSCVWFLILIRLAQASDSTEPSTIIAIKVAIKQQHATPLGVCVCVQWTPYTTFTRQPDILFFFRDLWQTPIVPRAYAVAPWHY